MHQVRVLEVESGMPKAHFFDNRGRLNKRCVWYVVSRLRVSVGKALTPRLDLDVLVPLLALFPMLPTTAAWMSGSAALIRSIRTWVYISRSYLLTFDGVFFLPLGLSSSNY